MTSKWDKLLTQFFRTIIFYSHYWNGLAYLFYCLWHTKLRIRPLWNHNLAFRLAAAIVMSRCFRIIGILSGKVHCSVLNYTSIPGFRTVAYLLQASNKVNHLTLHIRSYAFVGKASMKCKPKYCTVQCCIARGGFKHHFQWSFWKKKASQRLPCL